MTGLTDAATYEKIKMAANHLQAAGPDTTERWEEQFGKSPSSIAAEIAGLIAAADIARENRDSASADTWEATASSWRARLIPWTVTSSGFWEGHVYYERIDKSKASDPNDPNDRLCFQEGCFYAHDVADFGFLELVRLGVLPPNDFVASMSIPAAASASDGNSNVQVTMPNGDIYFHRYNHDNYGESNEDCSGWPSSGARRFGRPWPVLSGERGQYEIANGRSAPVYLQSMADAAKRRLFHPGAGLGQPGRLLFCARTANGQRRSAQLGGRAISASRPIDRRRLQPRHPLGRQGEVSGFRADPRKGRQVHKRRREREQRHGG